MVNNRKSGTAHRSRMTRLQISAALVGCLGLLLCACPARAGVAWSGDIDPSDPTTWTLSDRAYVGDYGVGTLDVTAGSTVVSYRGYVGYLSSSSGTVTLDGAGSTWTNATSLYVGRDGTGVLDILNGAAAINPDGYGYIGSGVGSSGTVTVDGAGSTWTNGDRMFIGDYGTGVVDISGGGTVTVGWGHIANRSGSSGTVTVDGVGSSWTNTDFVYVGQGGTGELNVLNGGTVSNTQTYMGYASGSSGTATVDGPGSTWTSSGTNFCVGYQGDAELSITDGGQVSSVYAFVGDQPGSTGTVVVDGADSTWTNYFLVIGEEGSGSLDITNGGTVIADHFYIGRESGSSGAVVVDGVGSSLTSNGRVWLDDGTSRLDITNGGTVTCDAFVGSGSVTVDGAGSSLTASGSNLAARTEVTNGGAVHGIGAIRAVVTVDGVGSSWTNDYDVRVGWYNPGELHITGGATASNRNGSIGYGSSSATGTATVSGAGSTWTNSGDLIVGDEGDGSLSIADGGAVTTGGDTWVSREASGTISFNNGSLTTGGLLSALSDLTGTGAIDTNGLVTDVDLVFDSTHGLSKTLVLNGEPGQNITLNLDVDGSGAMGAGYGGAGTMAIADGMTVNSTSGYIGYKAGATGTVTVDGAGSSWVNSGILSVAQDGTGELTITNGATVSNTDASLGSGQGSSATVTVSGAGSTWTNTGDLTVGSLGVGVVTIDSGASVSNADATIGSRFGQTATVTVDGAGTSWTSSGGLTVGYTYDGEGVLNISNGATVTAPLGTWVADYGLGTINFDNGTLTTGEIVGRTADLTGTGTLNTHGLITDVDLVFDAAHGLSQTFTLDIEAGQNITVNLDVDGSGVMGAGNTGSATMSILEGVGLASTYGVVGSAAGSAGTVTIDGAGSSWTNTGALTVADNGDGTLIITNGATASNTDGYLGVESGTSGAVTVSGAGSTWTNTGLLQVGGKGDGDLNITNGGSVSNGDGFLGYGSASGRVFVNGVGSMWTNTGDLAVGGGGPGELFIINSGLVRVDGTLLIDSFPGGAIRMTTGGMLALVGDADGSAAEFLGLVDGTDQIQYKTAIGSWLPITSGVMGDDFALTYYTTGVLAGYTLLTVDAVYGAPGDATGDGQVTAEDIDALVANIGNPSYDLDGDFDSDEDDLIYLVENLVEWSGPGGSGVGTARGDANLDGLVNATDLAVMQAGFGQSGIGWGGGNFNIDGAINATDLAIIQAQFGFAAAGAPVPEPMTLGLLAVGGLAALRRRNQ